MSTDRMLAVIWTMAIVSIGAAASAQTIDFEQFENRDNIFGLDLGGVSLRPRFGSQVHVYADNFVGNGHHSPVNSIIASNGGRWQPLVGEFDEPQGFIRLWGGDDGFDDDQWEFEAFDAQGASLGIVQSPVWNGKPYTSLTIRADGIMSFEARFIGQSDAEIAFDDLEFVPEGGCRADLNGDGNVNTQDFIEFLNAWAGDHLRADWNGDGAINTQDFIAYLNEWAAGC